MVDQPPGTGHLALDDGVAQKQGERVVADVVAGVQDRVAEAVPLLLADVVDVREVGDLPNTLQLLVLAGGRQLLLEFVGLVEVSIVSACARTGSVPRPT